MGKSAKFMRVVSHEKSKRVQKGSEWRESGLRSARREHKQAKQEAKAALVFGEDTCGEKKQAAKKGASPFPGLAQQLWSEYSSGDKKDASEGMTNKQKFVKANQEKKVKMGKIKLKGNL